MDVCFYRCSLTNWVIADLCQATSYMYMYMFPQMESVLVPSEHFRNPFFVTPEIQNLLRRLMRSNPIEQASANAMRIGGAIILRSSAKLKDVYSRHGTSSIWRRINRLTSRSGGGTPVDTSNTSFSSSVLNVHYADICPRIPTIPIPSAAIGRPKYHPLH